jgi:hypothetical protein
VKAPRSGDSTCRVIRLKFLTPLDVPDSPSEVARSLLVECVVKGLNGAGECVVSEMELVML